MEPRSYIRVSISALALRIPSATKPSGSEVHSTTSPCLCDIRLANLPPRVVPVTAISSSYPEPDSRSVFATFYLDESQLQSFLSPSCFVKSSAELQISVLAGKHPSGCVSEVKRTLGKFRLPITHEWLEGRAVQPFCGWTSVGQLTKGGSGKSGGGHKSLGENGATTGTGQGAELHLCLNVEPDPRYIFEFDGQTTSSPQVVQVHRNTRQTIFTCVFSKETGGSRRFGPMDLPMTSSGDRTPNDKERKGWTVVIHDLNGFPVAGATMVTPFVPSSGSDRVSRTNPGAWLIWRPEQARNSFGESPWRAWGRLEAWREKAQGNAVAARFELLPDGGGVPGVGPGTIVADAVLNGKKGGEFTLDEAMLRADGGVRSRSGAATPIAGAAAHSRMGSPFSGAGGGAITFSGGDRETARANPSSSLTSTSYGGGIGLLHTGSGMLTPEQRSPRSSWSSGSRDDSGRLSWESASASASSSFGMGLLDGHHALALSQSLPGQAGRSSGLIMSAEVRGRSGKASLQVASRYLASISEAALFVALTAAVDLSLEACQPFRGSSLFGGQSDA